MPMPSFSVLRFLQLWRKTRAVGKSSIEAFQPPEDSLEHDQNECSAQLPPDAPEQVGIQEKPSFQCNLQHSPLESRQQSPAQSPRRSSESIPTRLPTEMLEIDVDVSPSSSECMPQSSNRNVLLNLLNFDIPVEQVYAGVSATFGEMITWSLQSKLWDKRAQALDAMNHTLKMRATTWERFDEHDRQWRLSCLVLHHVLPSKVVPVQRAALELFATILDYPDGSMMQEQVHFAIDVLIEHVIDRLGDSNVLMHETARECILLCSQREELLGLKCAFTKLRVRLTSVNGKAGGKVYIGVLDTVNFLLQQFHGYNVDVERSEPTTVDSWNQYDVAPFIILGLGDSLGARVRNTTVALAVTVYKALGMDAMLPVIQCLRPAKQALLKQIFLAPEMEFDAVPPSPWSMPTPCERTNRRAPPLRKACKTVENLGCMEGLENQLKISKHSASTALMLKPRNQGACLPPLPGHVVMETDEEELLMDAVLEDAGLVFNGAELLVEEHAHVEDEIFGMVRQLEGNFDDPKVYDLHSVTGCSFSSFSDFAQHQFPLEVY